LKVLLTGARGQVGRALLKSAPQGIQLRALSHAEMDITNAPQVHGVMQEARPDVVINAAAYTAVDRAETEVEAARAVNELGARTLADAAAVCGARLVHLSTDFVFDGQSSLPYLPTDPTGPLSVYGRSKLAGERAVQMSLPGRSLILRTAWVYAPEGHNFVRTMLRLMREKGAVRVVTDQIGAPTAAHSIAAAVWKLVAHPDLSGIYHWTDAGVASWYDFAVAIAEEGAALGHLTRPVEVTPIATEEYPLPARRPRFSVLDRRTTVAAIGMMPPHWRVNLRRVLGDMIGA